MNKNSLIQTLLVALFAALISVGAYLKIMVIPPVPITLQTLFIVLVGLLLPLKLSLSSILVYLFIGAIGLPVFTSGGGLGALLGPTGGYLFGAIPAVIAGSLLMKFNKKNNIWLLLLIALVETILIYAVGLPWLGITRHLSVTKTLVGGLYPFLIGDTLKIIVAALVAKAVKGKVDLLLTKNTEEEN